MDSNWIGKVTNRVKLLIEVVLILAVMAIVFDSVIQPLLVDIDPMFSDQYAGTGEWSGRYPDSPAGIAFFVSYAIGFAAYKYGRIFVAGVKAAFASDDESMSLPKAIAGTLVAMIGIFLPKSVNEWLFR